MMGNEKEIANSIEVHLVLSGLRCAFASLRPLRETKQIGIGCMENEREIANSIESLFSIIRCAFASLRSLREAKLIGT